MPSPPRTPSIDHDEDERHDRAVGASIAELSVLNSLNEHLIMESRKPKSEISHAFPSTSSRLDPERSSISTSTMGQEKEKPVWRRVLSFAKWFIIDQYFLFGFAVSILIASQV